MDKSTALQEREIEDCSIHGTIGEHNSLCETLVPAAPGPRGSGEAHMRVGTLRAQAGDTFG